MKPAATTIGTLSGLAIKNSVQMRTDAPYRAHFPLRSQVLRIKSPRLRSVIPNPRYETRKAEEGQSTCKTYARQREGEESRR